MKDILDIKDKKLIYELDKDSRQSLNQIGKKIGLSRTALLNRLNNLKDSGVIKSFHTVIDPGKLGYISFRIFVSFQNITPDKERDIISFLKNKKETAWIVSIEGEYDLGFVVLTRTIKEMDDFWTELIEKYGNYFEKRLMTIMTGVLYFSRAYLLDLKKNKSLLETFTPPNEIGLDFKDKEILKSLAQDSRTPIVDLALKVKLTPKTVIEKIKKLEFKKVIVGYKTVFNLEKLGYQYFKIHLKLNNLTKEKKIKLEEYIKYQPNIVYYDKVLGGDDIEIEIQVKDMFELRQIMSEMKNDFGDIIKDDKILEYYKEHKYFFLPLDI